MKKITTLFLLIIIIATGFSMTDRRVYANSFVDAIDRDKVITIAKGTAALFLLNRVYNVIDSYRERDKKTKQLNDSAVVSSVISSRPGSRSVKPGVKVIVIDPGHGGSDPGAVGPGGLKEKDVNLDIALKLFNLLKKDKSVQVYITRDSDRYVSLSQRSALARRVNADIFISIHSNADDQGRQTGVETYAYYDTSQESWELAWYIQNQLVNNLKFIDRGLKADNFQVIRETSYMKSVLLEIGFISNPVQERQLRNTQTREKAAVAIYRGIKEYFNAN